MTTSSPAQRLDELLAGPVGRDTLDELLGCIYDSYANVDMAHDRVRDMAEQLPEREGEDERDLREKVGILEFAMGEYGEAVETLAPVRSRKTASHFIGRAYLHLGREHEALDHLEKGRAGDEDLGTVVCMVEAHCRLRDHAEAERLLKSVASERAGSADYLYCRGRIADTRGEYAEAIELYEAALERNPEHAASLFYLAANCDLNGDDHRAMELYQRCVSLNPTYVGALLNLGVLYEDHGMHAEAIDCYKRILAIDPRHKQAQLYLKDAESSLTMFIDLSRIRRMQHLQEIFSLPVSNFELSARSRNTLDRMDIRTLGGLTKVSREALLNEKNFGDTSLGEIENLLDRYDLELGVVAAEGPVPGAEGIEDAATLAKLQLPIEEMDFSTRCRKCMERLGIKAVGQLVQLSEAHLLETPNFGATSLQEVRDKLEALGLSLRAE